MKSETKLEKPEEVKTEENKETKPTTRPVSKNMRWGIANIYSSYNNTIVTITDISGCETLARTSGGMFTKSHRLEGSPTMAMMAAKAAGEQAIEKGLNALHIKLRAPGGQNGPQNVGPGSNAVVRTLSRMGFKIGIIEDVTKLPHGGCRKRGGRRGRRV